MSPVYDYGLVVHAQRTLDDIRNREQYSSISVEEQQHKELLEKQLDTQAELKRSRSKIRHE